MAKDDFEIISLNRKKVVIATTLIDCVVKVTKAGG